MIKKTLLIAAAATAFATVAHTVQAAQTQPPNDVGHEIVQIITSNQQEIARNHTLMEDEEKQIMILYKWQQNADATQASPDHGDLDTMKEVANLGDWMQKLQNQLSDDEATIATLQKNQSNDEQTIADLQAEGH